MKLSLFARTYTLSAFCFGSTASSVLPSHGEKLGHDQCPIKLNELHRGSSDRAICLHAIDDESSKQTQSLWTHVPRCLEAVIGDYGGKFCVYTAAFFGDNGLSLVTTPEAAANAIGTILDTYHSSFPSPKTVVGLGKLSAYEIVDIPGKGKGVVATRLINRHETFMVDYAVLLTDVGFPVSVSPAQRRSLLRLATEQLAYPEGATGLARSGDDDLNLVEDVMGTNSFGAELGGISHKILFPIISRMNHACAPK
jgi:hypothetical protein